MDEVAEIKNRLEIAEVIGAYLPLKQAGRNLKAPCPFHEERTASFMVSPDKGIYHCFGCHEGGDVFSFVQKMEGLDFREALERLARQAGVELASRRGENGAAAKLRARLLEAHELAAKYFQASLVKNPKALEYVVKRRGLGREVIRDFQIGYAPDTWEALTGFLLKRGFSVAELVQGGLAGQKQGRSTGYDLFRGRVMFTICDREGRPIGFTGRVLDDSLPKYLNTPQTPLYDKSTAIFGLHLAREAIRSHDEVVLVEGNMDVIASHQAGVKQVVAASGTALTLEQLRSLSKLTKNIKLSFDADRAGLAATERAIELGQKLGLTLRMVVIASGKDPDELIAKDVEAWRSAIASAKYIMDYLFDRFERDYDLTSAMGKRQYADRLAANLRRLGDPVEQDHYVKLLAEKTGTSEEAVRAKVAQVEAAAQDEAARAGARTAERQRAATVKTGQGPGAGWQAPEQAEEPELPRAKVPAAGRPSVAVQQEERLLALTLVHPITRISLDDVYAESFTTEERQEVFTCLVQHREEPSEQIVDRLQQSVYVKQLLLVAEQEFAQVPEQQLAIQAFELAQLVSRHYYDRLKRQIGRQLKAAEQAGDEELATKLRMKFQDVLNQMLSLS